MVFLQQEQNEKEKSSQELNPEPFLRALKENSDSMNKLNERIEENLVALVQEIKDEEKRHKEDMADLNKELEVHNRPIFFKKRSTNLLFKTNPKNTLAHCQRISTP